MFKNLNNNIDKIKAWGLRKKILVSMIALLLLLGLTTIVITRMILPKVLRTEFQHKGLSSAKTLAANTAIDILTQNTSRLKKLIDNEKKLDADIAYIFIVDPSGHILAHTFDRGFPTDLAKVNNLEKDRDFNIQTLDTQQGFIYDTVVPIFLERSLLGHVHLGILQNRIQRTINAINLLFIGMTLFVIALGILLAHRISSLITKPISKLVDATQSIQKGDFTNRIDVKTKDEIGLLALAFNEMASRLNQMVEEIRRLTTVEERNRIALDLHDGCAQNMANIIKRLELCEKLFKIDPQKAIEELNSLKEITKNMLNQTRHIIYDLKSAEDIDFNLMHNLKNYMKEFQEQNNIIVKLEVSGSIKNISLNKSKTIYYIILEALNNIRKHSLAKNAEVSLETNNGNNLTVYIKDNGKGFDVNDVLLNGSRSKKLGLISMRHRASYLGGIFAIKSQPQQGTEISVDIPMGDGWIDKS